MSGLPGFDVMNIKAQTCHSETSYGVQSGFSLVELMVAITISLLVLASLSAVYVNLARSNNELAKTNIQIENGRLATDLLKDEISHAGFWGSYVPQFDDLSSTAVPVKTDAGGTVPTAVPAPCLEYNPTNWTAEYKGNLIGIPIQIYDAVPAGCTDVVKNKLDNTDVLVVRHAETCLPGVGNCEDDVAGKLYFQSTLCSTETATPYMLDTAGFTLHKKNCTTLADKRKFTSSIYYIRNYAVTAGDGIPTLVRAQFDLWNGALGYGDPVALIEGIEAFRVELGIDNVSDSGAAVDYTHEVAWADPSNLISPTNRGDGSPDGAFIHCTSAVPCTVPQLSNTVAAKLYLVARSREPTAGYTDNKTYALGSTSWTPTSTTYKRHVFSTTVRLTNVSGRRETP